MKHVKLFENFNKTISGNQVAQHIKNITPQSSDVPDFFITKFILPNKFEKIEINIKNLLETDPVFNDYFESGENRYEPDEITEDDLNLPIVVFDGKILDGYSRTTELLKRGEKTTTAYVNITTNNK